MGVVVGTPHNLTTIADEVTLICEYSNKPYGVYTADNGAYYCVVFQLSVPNTGSGSAGPGMIQVYKSLDGTTWTIQDAQAYPSPSIGQGSCHTFDGRYLYVAYAQSNGSTFYPIWLRRFDTSTDTWGTATDSGQTQIAENFSYFRRSDNTDVLVLYSFGTGNSPGQVLAPFAGSGDWVHNVYYNEDTDSICHKSLAPGANPASGWGTESVVIANADQHSIGTPVEWNGKLYVPFVSHDQHSILLAVGSEEENPTWTVSTVRTVYPDQRFLAGDHGYIAAAVAGDQLCLVYTVRDLTGAYNDVCNVIVSADATTWSSPTLIKATDPLETYLLLLRPCAVGYDDGSLNVAYQSGRVGFVGGTVNSVGVTVDASSIAVSSSPSFQAEGTVGTPDIGVESVEVDCSITIFPSSVVTPGTCLWIDLWVWRQLTTFDSLSTNVALAPGYEKALTLALASQIASEYRRLPHPKVLELATKARAAIEDLNASNHVASEDPPDA